MSSPNGHAIQVDAFNSVLGKHVVLVDGNVVQHGRSWKTERLTFPLSDNPPHHGLLTATATWRSASIRLSLDVDGQRLIDV